MANNRIKLIINSIINYFSLQNHFYDVIENKIVN